MKPNLTDFPRKAQFPLMLAAGTLPVLALILLYNAPAFWGTLSLFIPAYVLIAWLCLVIPGKIRVFAGVLGCAMLMALGFYQLPILQSVSVAGQGTLRVSQSALTLLIPLLLCFLLLYGLQIAAWPREREIPFNWYAVGVCAHLFALLLSLPARRSGSPEWERAMPVLTGGFVLFLALVLLSMNRSTMFQASLGRQQIVPSMRRRNTAITLSLFGFSLIIAGIPAISRFIRRVCLLAAQLIGHVMALLAKLLETDAVPSGGGAGGGAQPMMAAAYQEPSLLAVILERITTVLVFAAVLLVILIVLHLCVRRLLQFIQALIRRFTRYMVSASQDYIDEITDTREERSEREGSLLAHLRSRIAVVNESRLTPGERIRYRYRQLLRRHPDWQASSTARENLPEDTATLYERARYSGEDVTAEDARKFADGIRNA